MKRNALLFGAVAGIAAAIGSFAIAQNQHDASMPEMQLPPGWTQEDMMACVIAGTPGEQHAFLAEAAGTWYGTCKMWMAPGMEPMVSEVVTTNTVIMDGRYVECVTKGEMPGMGEFHGRGVYGFDNLRNTYVSNWIDNHGTGIMNGTGKLSADQKTMTWTFSHICPITKQPTTLREVETIISATERKFEMFGPDPKTGKEYKLMEIAYKRGG